MRRAICLAVIAMFVVMAVPAGAHVINNTTIVNEEDNWDLGVKADAPNLVKVAENWTVGVEVSKLLNGTDATEGYSGFAKVTYTGNIFDLSGIFGGSKNE
jgi:hypothetical protein